MRRLLLTWCLLLAGIGCISQSEAFWQSRDSNYNKKISTGAAPSTTTWNPSDKDAGITLSSGNLVATSSTTLANCSVSGYCGVRAVANHTTGKYYYELVVTNLGSAANDDNVGFGDSSAALNNHLGANGDSMAMGHTANGIQGGGGCGSVTMLGFIASDVLSFAADVGANLIWFRVNGGNWNNDPTGNPATGILGCDISTFSGAAYPMITGSNDANTVFTANFGGSAYAESVPVGFGNW